MRAAHGDAKSRQKVVSKTVQPRRVCDGTLFSPPILDYVDDSLIDSLTLYTHSLVNYSGENTLHSLSATIQNPRTKRPHMKGNTHSYSPSWSLCELTRVPNGSPSVTPRAAHLGRRSWVGRHRQAERLGHLLRGRVLHRHREAVRGSGWNPPERRLVACLYSD